MATSCHCVHKQVSLLHLVQHTLQPTRPATKCTACTDSQWGFGVDSDTSSAEWNPRCVLCNFGAAGVPTHLLSAEMVYYLDYQNESLGCA